MSKMGSIAKLCLRSNSGPVRQFSTRSGFWPKQRNVTPVLIGSVTVGVGCFAAYKLRSKQLLTVPDLPLFKPPAVFAATFPTSQPSVYSQTKNHALFLWIHVKSTANPRDVARSIAKLQKYVDVVSDPSLRDEEDEILAGVGFGPNFYSQVAGKTRKSFNYPHRKGSLGDLPSTGGDVFIHAKSNTYSKLFELAQVVLKNLPPGSVDKYEDIYSFVYKNGRDLSGFIDGTENPADDEHRKNVAVEAETGGSYVIAQKWIHKHNVIGAEKDKTQEGWVGRSKPDSLEQSRKGAASHVARMTGGTAFGQKKMFEIVRQSMPYGTLSGQSGLFFIGYAASPLNFEYMLDRMVGAGGDGVCDDILHLTESIKGTYWYFPGVAELKKLE